jgi:hypothetical protein
VLANSPSGAPADPRAQRGVSVVIPRGVAHIQPHAFPPNGRPDANGVGGGRVGPSRNPVRSSPAVWRGPPSSTGAPAPAMDGVTLPAAAKGRSLLHVACGGYIHRLCLDRSRCHRPGQCDRQSEDANRCLPHGPPPCLREPSEHRGGHGPCQRRA